MAYPIVLIIEPDLSFAAAITQKLKPFGISTLIRTEISDPDQLVEIENPIQSIIINLELKSVDGLTLYSYVKNLKRFRSTTFLFLTSDENTFNLLENMPLERSVVLRKNLDIEVLTAKILNNVNFLLSTENEHGFYTEIRADISQLPVKDIMLYCSISRVSGRLVLNHNDEFAIISYSLGKIESVSFVNYEQDEALKILISWTEGNFRLERGKLSIPEIIKIINSNKQTTYIPELEFGDIFTDLFNFLYSYLTEQLPEFQVQEIFKKKIRDISKKQPQISNIQFDLTSDDKVKFSTKLENADISYLFTLFNSIFDSAKFQQPEIERVDLLEYLSELAPYLEKVNFSEHFLMKANSEHPLPAPQMFRMHSAHKIAAI